MLRPLAPTDHDALAQAARDPGIWAGHPARDRHRPEAFAPYFQSLLDLGGSLAIIDRQKDQMIGCSAFYTDPDAPSRLSIGFTFLTREHWGGDSNRAVKALMLGHIYAHSSEAWFHIAPSNLRSQAATRKLGAVMTHEGMIDLGGGPQRWQCYCLTQQSWQASG
ncbi:MAG: GNAT family N-acetyltransferase [Marinibacterium sp.]|nr:GNAT family N-acetyltransferase [Marinibacterium sp.]